MCRVRIRCSRGRLSDLSFRRNQGPANLCRKVRDRFGLDATVVDGVVRIEREHGREFIAQLVLVEAFPGRIDSVTVSKPTLEDVFIHQTG